MILDDLDNLADAALDIAARDLGEPRLPPSRLVLSHAAEALMLMVPGQSCGNVLRALGCSGGPTDGCFAVARAMSPDRFDHALPLRIAAQLAHSPALRRAA